ncbi:polysaccharide biosynthesis/export family protein [Alienimonas californiensis]|uniref:polysaccharide biosynthesis/export family protein n=1 Tax=Alienimonas californiensis TaxID=2527989 RepID=UPI0013FD0744|nr:polysaccharide biosynthesis/export family protein [Alienimonas californiensis]
MSAVRGAFALGARGPRRLAAAALLVLLAATSGCAAFRSLEGVPAGDLSPDFRQPVRSGLETIDLTLLRRTPPPQHRVDAGDVLSVYIEGVLGGPDQAPPISSATLALDRPSVGYPIEVREDGTLALPFAGAVSVRGLTLPQVEATLREEFTERRALLKTGQERVLVSLQRPRTHSVLVIRQESGNRQGNLGSAGTVNFELDKRGTGRIVDLPVYQNDVLHALAATGGLPGLDAQNVIYVLRRPRVQTIPPEQHPGPEAPVAPAAPAEDADSENGSEGERTYEEDLDEEAEAFQPTPPANFRPAAPMTVWRGQSPDGPTAASYGAPQFALPAGFSLNDRMAGPPPAPAPVPSAGPSLPALPEAQTFPAPTPLRATPVSTAPPAIPAPAPWPISEEVAYSPEFAGSQFIDAAPGEPTFAPDGRLRVPAERCPADGFGIAAATMPCAENGFPPFPLLGRSTMGGPHVLRIPVRLTPGCPVPFTEEDVTLYDGDIVFVEHREPDVFYTGGLLGGGQYQLPQNYDIDVLEALAIVRQRGGSTDKSPLTVGGPSSLNQDVTVGASRLIILRKDELGRELRVEVDLEAALRDPGERVLVRPGDYLVLRYTKCEACGAFVERLVFESFLSALANAALFRQFE